MGSFFSPVEIPPLIDESNLAMKALGKISMYVRVNQYFARVHGFFVTAVTLELIPRNKFLDCHMNSTLLPQRNMHFDDAPSLALSKTTPMTLNYLMASRSTAQKLPQRTEELTRKHSPIQKTTPSREIDFSSDTIFVGKGRRVPG